MINRNVIYFLLFVLVFACAESAFCITDANIKSAFKEVSDRGVSLTNIVLAISGLAAIGFAMFQEYGIAKGFAVGTGLFAGYKHFVGDGSSCTLDIANEFLSSDISQVIAQASDQFLQLIC